MSEQKLDAGVGAPTPVQVVIAELEKATEGSGKLDGDIAEVLGIAREAMKAYFGMRRCEDRKGYLPVDRGEWARDTPTHKKWKAPCWTTSLSEALTLLPEGAEWWVQSDGEAQLILPTKDRINGRANSPALALCIATLKACAASDASATATDQKSAPRPT